MTDGVLVSFTVFETVVVNLCVCVCVCSVPKTTLMLDLVDSTLMNRF